MPRYYCDYCDTYLTHDSPSVRKQHNQGYKHKANVRNYYQQFEEQQTQSLIDQKVKEHLGQHLGGGFMLAPGQYRPPLRPLSLPVPGSNPATNMPPVMRPPIGTNPGYVMPQAYRPPVAPLPQSNGLPPPPSVPPLNVPGTRPPGVAPANGSLPTSAPPHAPYQQPSTNGYNYSNVPGGYSQQQANMNSAPGYGSTPPGYGSTPPGYGSTPPGTGSVSAAGSNPPYGQSSGGVPTGV